MDTVRLPKIELHAHLNGSISPATMRRLLEAKQGILEDAELARIRALVEDTTRDLKTCFELFGCIYKLVDNLDALEMITRDVLQEFEADGVVYLELRSTPKAFPGSSKQEYIETILRIMEEFQDDHSMRCRLIVSVDRTKGSAEAAENVELAARYKERGVVGVDLCGNPAQGDVQTVIPSLLRARESGLKLTVHLAELDRPSESAELLRRLRPDRIGHGTFLQYDHSGMMHRHHAHVPVEVCLTSNIRCQTVDAIDNHHIADIVAADQPFCVCTDDKGVFGTTLSREWDLAVSSGHLRMADVYRLTTLAAAYTFLPLKQQEELLARMVEGITAVAGSEAATTCATPDDLKQHHEQREREQQATVQADSH